MTRNQIEVRLVQATRKRDRLKRDLALVGQQINQLKAALAQARQAQPRREAKKAPSSTSRNSV